MKRKIVLTIAFFHCFAPIVFSQSNFSLSAGIGIIQSYGTAGGVEFGIKRIINDNLRFQLTTGIYNWGERRNLNKLSYLDSNYDSRIIREMDLLIPLRAGFNFKFGNSDSHPFLSVEWSVNYVTNDFSRPAVENIDGLSSDRIYIKSTKNTVFVSLGFNMGYSFCLSDYFNVVTGVNWQSGEFAQFVGFVSGIEYKL